MAIESKITIELDTTDWDDIDNITHAIRAVLGLQSKNFNITQSVPSLVDLSFNDEKSILTWIHEVDYIATIKRVRESFGCTLYNAKQVVDNLLTEYKINRFNHPMKVNGGFCSECGQATYYYTDENVLFHSDYSEVRDKCPSATRPMGVK